MAHHGADDAPKDAKFIGAVNPRHISRSLGMLNIAWRMRKTPKGEMTQGRIMPSRY